MSNAPAHYDPAAPIAALEAIGIAVRKSTTSTSSDVQLSGVSVNLGASAGERWAFTLPNPVALDAAFAKEGVGKKLVKIFMKELQVGDPEFDAKVYVATSNQEATGRFLQNADARALIAEFVGDGGTVIVKDNQITIHAVTKGMVAVVSEKDVARLVCHVLAFT